MTETRLRHLLNIWRQVARQPRLSLLAPALLEQMSGDMGVDRLGILQLDPPRQRLEVLAWAGPGQAPATAQLRDAELRWWLALLGDPAPEASRHGGPLPGLAAATRSIHSLTLTLSDGEFPCLLLLGFGLPPSAAMFDLLPEMAAPFAAAVENDHRIHELITLREAAEADRQSLLSRLRRVDVSDTIVGDGKGLKPVLQRVDLVAPSDVPVLILGETGSGKEVVARAVHRRSRRATGPFIRVNCGAIPPELIDSELFGHEKGSFTGAVSARQGWFERADGGTLFLDEVGELSPAAQVRLLRILQDGSFQRVGAQQASSVDVRVVAATNRDLHAMVVQGQFREDLWYRLAVFPIHLPALRERPEDIPDLAAHFALRAAQRLGLTARQPDAADLELLAAYPWPGNVRELASVIERAAILGEGQGLEVAKALGVAPPPLRLPPRSTMPAATAAAPPSAIQAMAGGEAPGGTLDEVARHHIEAVLEQCLGRIEGPFGAARLLGINANTLRGRMRKLGIEPRRYRQRG